MNQRGLQFLKDLVANPGYRHLTATKSLTSQQFVTEPTVTLREYYSVSYLAANAKNLQWSEQRSQFRAKPFKFYQYFGRHLRARPEPPHYRRKKLVIPVTYYRTLFQTNVGIDSRTLISDLEPEMESLVSFSYCSCHESHTCIQKFDKA